MISRLFNLPLAILATSSYRAGGGTEQGRLDIAASVTMARGSLDGRILLVDDLVDSGVTLQQVQAQLLRSEPAVTEVRTAVIWYKQCSALKPDYFLHHLHGNPWIHQPFERYDGMGFDQLQG